MTQPAGTKQRLSRLQGVIARCCLRNRKQGSSLKEARHRVSGHQGAGQFTAVVKLPASLPQNVHAQVFEGRSQTKTDAKWRAVLKALRCLSDAGLLSSTETSTLIEVAGSGRGNGAGEHVLHEAQEDEQLKRLAHQLTHLQLLMGHKFKDLKLLTTAVLQFGGKATDTSFRRLAFLGDSLLGTAATLESMRLTTDSGANAAHKHREQLITRAACAKYAETMDLQTLLPAPATAKKMAESFEAILGAMYTDAGGGAAGMTAVFEFFGRLVLFFPG